MMNDPYLKQFIVLELPPTALSPLVDPADRIQRYRGDVRYRLSKRERLLEHSLPDARFEAVLAGHVDLAAQQALQFQDEGGVIEKAAPGRELYQEIDIAFGAILAARY
jgi:hypothetical protein